MILNRDFLGQNLWVTNSLDGTERRDTRQETAEMTIPRKNRDGKKKLHYNHCGLGKASCEILTILKLSLLCKKGLKKRPNFYFMSVLYNHHFFSSFA